MQRCSWVNLDKPHYVKYHDTEWGRPVHDDRTLFEMLILEGAQAGLTWETILKRREEYRRIFKNFDPKKVARMKDDELEQALLDPGIIRNRLKVYATRKNAQVFLEIQKEFGSFDKYVWGYVDNKPRVKIRVNIDDIPTRSEVSDALSKNLKTRGMSFIGTIIMYSYMQAIGMVNDHMRGCYLSECKNNY